jgi:hypothetical protein
MKFVEKKCPNCGANLKFEAGERNATCESCRREFVVQYDAQDIAGDIKDAVNKIKADSVNLVPAAKIFGTFFTIHTIVVSVIAVIIFGVVAFGMVHMIISFNQTKEDHRQREEDMSEQFQKNVEEMNKQMEDAQKRFESQHSNQGSE